MYNVMTQTQHQMLATCILRCCKLVKLIIWLAWSMCAEVPFESSLQGPNQLIWGDHQLLGRCLWHPPSPCNPAAMEAVTYNRSHSCTKNQTFDNLLRAKWCIPQIPTSHEAASFCTKLFADDLTCDWHSWTAILRFLLNRCGYLWMSV